MRATLSDAATNHLTHYIVHKTNYQMKQPHHKQHYTYYIIYTMRPTNPALAMRSNTIFIAHNRARSLAYRLPDVSAHTLRRFAYDVLRCAIACVYVTAQNRASTCAFLITPRAAFHCSRQSKRFTCCNQYTHVVVTSSYHQTFSLTQHSHQHDQKEAKNNNWGVAVYLLCYVFVMYVCYICYY